VQRPRLGVFGWQENYLMVGLPLLRGLSPDEVRAVNEVQFPGATSIVVLENDFKPLRKILEGIEGAQIYNANKP
jgi:hypothetical protein